MNIKLEKCRIEDYEDFYKLKCDEENIYWTGYVRKPEKNELKKWYYEQLQSKSRIMFFAKDEINGEVVGYLYLDLVGEKENIIETGHGVYSIYKGKGIGTQIIKLAIQHVRDELIFVDKIVGWILENNIGSIKNVLKNGYVETDSRKSIFLESANKVITMRKYVYKLER